MERTKYPKSRANTGVVLVAEWYVENGWYGDRYRCILLDEKGHGFPNKTAALKYAAKLKKYAKSKYRISTTMFKVYASTMDKCPTYIYSSFGPSRSWKHYFTSISNITNLKTA